MKIVRLTIVTLLFWSSGQAFAEGGTCPDGYYPIGGQGVAGCAPIPNYVHTPLPPAPPPPEPSDVLSGAVRAMYQSFSTNREEMDRMKSDPRHKQFMEGDWKFYDDIYQGEKMCGALFLKQGQAVMLFGPGNPGESGFISFLDYRENSTIPRPKKGQEIRATLTQNSEPPQTVAVMNQTGASGEGILRFAVPRMDAITNSIDDTMAFKVAVKDKVVVDIVWRDGRKAQEAMRKCIGM